MDRLTPRDRRFRDGRTIVAKTGEPLSDQTLTRLEDERRLVSVAMMAREMAVEVVTAEWPNGFVRTMPTTKGVVKLLMQDPPERTE